MSVPTPIGEVAAQPLPAWSERAYQHVLTGALASLGFFVLFSTAGVSISLFVLALLCVASPGRLWATRPWRNPLLALGLLLFAYILLRTVLVDGGFTRPGLAAVNRYHELLMIPLLWALMRNARRPQAFANGLILGALVFATLHWLAPMFPKIHHFFLFSRRVSGGFGLAVCAFLLFEHARLGRLPAAAGYAGAIFLSATVVFASEGRTGYVVLLALLVCAAFRAAPARLRLAVVLAILVTSVLVAGASDPIRMRLEQTLHEAQSTGTGAASPGNSTGTRIELLRTGAEIAGRHWLVGTGWGNYAAVFQEVAAENGMQVQNARVSNPHNEYLLQLGSGGLPALLLYLLWVGWPMWVGLRDRDKPGAWTGPVGCVALAFALGSLFNSVLLDFIEGHFYGTLMAWLMVRRVGE